MKRICAWNMWLLGLDWKIELRCAADGVTDGGQNNNLIMEAAVLIRFILRLRIEEKVSSRICRDYSVSGSRPTNPQRKER